jgi:uncharacterized protein
MIEGYRMSGPPPHGEPPPAPQPERESGWPVWLGFVTLLAVFLVSNVIYAVIFAASGANPDDTPAWLDITAAVILEASLVLGALGAARAFKPLHPWQFGLRPTNYWRAAWMTAVAFVVFFGFAILWAALISQPKQTTAEDLGVNESHLALIAAGVMFVLIAPVAEELFFRGFFYGSLRTRLSMWPAALIVGLVFGLIHWSTGVSAVPALIVFGVILCVLREKTGSLYPCIALHAVNNAFAYAGLTKVAPEIAAGFGALMVAAVSIVPRIAWRRPPRPA